MKNLKNLKNLCELGVEKTLQELNSNVSIGLTTSEAYLRLKKYGSNELVEPLRSLGEILWEQVSATLVIVLIVSAVITPIFGDYREALGIIAMIILICCLGFTQEYRAQKAILTLKKLSIPNVKTLRDGYIQQISARDLVPGDIIHLDTEDIVPADCQLIESQDLRVEESAISGICAGTSQIVDKYAHQDICKTEGSRDNLGLAEGASIIYKNSVVIYGQAKAIVTQTGMNTEFGRVMIRNATKPKLTPLQLRLNQLGRTLTIAVLAIVGLILILGLIRGEDPKLMLLTAITLVVAALPEGLPAVVTITLALGASSLLKQRTLVRNLGAVETLGCVTVIGSGKTGTLTENRMSVTVLDVAGYRLDLTTYINSCSSTQKTQQPFLLCQPPALSLLLASGALCNDALIEFDQKEPRCFQTIGDPTEAALLMAAAQQGIWKNDLETSLPRLRQVQCHRSQIMTTIHKLPNSSKVPCALEALWRLCREQNTSDIAFSKGQVSSLLDISTHIWVNGRVKPLNELWRKHITNNYKQLIQSGLRVTGVAFKPLVSSEEWEDVENLIFIGLVGMNDPARPQVRDAVVSCQRAGIRPVMITGDHPLTARTIAKEVNITTNNRVITGAQISNLSSHKFIHALESVSVYAQTSPADKLAIVESLQRNGHVVAMTGDGINDAPTLRIADIGIAMGIRGTDAAKEAADIVLLDDNFASIVAAIKQGRVIYDNIRKFIKYLLSSNIGELLVMLIAPFVGMPLPLLPLQILWINLVTDGLPAFALSWEPAEHNIMNRPPFPNNENIFSRGLGKDIVWIGLLLGAVSLGIGYLYFSTGATNWQTMLFTVLTLSQMGNALAIRSETDSLFKIGLSSNKPLLIAVALTFVMQLAVVYVPLFEQVFSTKPLSAIDLILCLGLSSVVFWTIELKKLYNRHQQHNPQSSAARYQQVKTDNSLVTPHRRVLAKRIKQRRRVNTPHSEYITASKYQSQSQK
ncbi:MAG: cation-translocating P-type ATPase [Calothrix sp. C42_A2020_038]|nr:cation-translocating P-type ATPase [Calothrix sp. C42_A2020_038]